MKGIFRLLKPVTHDATSWKKPEGCNKSVGKNRVMCYTKRFQVGSFLIKSNKF